MGTFLCGVVCGFPENGISFSNTHRQESQLRKLPEEESSHLVAQDQGKMSCPSSRLGRLS